MIRLKPEELSFSKASVADEAGMVFFLGDRVLRAVFTTEHAEFFKDLLGKAWLKDLYDKGLVRTWLCDDVEVEGVPLVLEHQKIRFELHPAEQTALMFWQVAKKIVDLSNELSKHGYLLKDGHPWNLMFHKANPYFIDFGSIVSSRKVSVGWFEEFKKYFGVPVWLASTKRWNTLAREYRRQHLVGFGLKLLDLPMLSRFGVKSLNKLVKYREDPEVFFGKLTKWLDKHKPVAADAEYWSGYNQDHDTQDPMNPTTVKQQFVYDVISHEKPESVLDCAANKGFYSEMAARHGASVASFDREEFCVDECLRLAEAKNLDLTPAIMDFRLPTPPYGIGLCGPSAFERFRSDIVLALGLAHHLCISQRLPVRIFCDICSKYAKKGIVFEYVDPSDKHVAAWNKPRPRDYSLEEFIRQFSVNFPKVKKIQHFDDDGLSRAFVYFSS